MKRLIVIGLSVVTTVIIAFGGYWLVSEGNEIIPGANLKELRTSERYANNSMDNPTEEGDYLSKKLLMVIKKATVRSLIKVIHFRLKVWMDRIL